MPPAERPDPPPARRADARRNRARLLEAARQQFLTHGAAAAMEDIARRAGVAEGTVYRHFPTKASLVHALVTERVEDLCDRARRALQDDDPGAGLYRFLREAADAHAGDRGFRDAVTAHLGQAAAGGVPDVLADLLARLVRRAQDGGALRDDVTHADLLHMIAVLPDRDPARATHLAVLVDGLRTPPGGRQR